MLYTVVVIANFDTRTCIYIFHKRTDQNLVFIWYLKSDVFVVFILAKYSLNSLIYKHNLCHKRVLIQWKEYRGNVPYSLYSVLNLSISIFVLILYQHNGWHMIKESLLFLVVTAVGAECQRGWFHYEHSCYFISSTRKSWADAAVSIMSVPNSEKMNRGILSIQTRWIYAVIRLFICVIIGTRCFQAYQKALN